MAGTKKTAKDTLIRNQQKKRKEEYEKSGTVSRQSDIAGYSAQTLERYGIDSGKVLGNRSNAGSAAAGSGSGRVKSSKGDFISAYRDRTAGGTVTGTAGGTNYNNWKRGILTQEQAAQRETAATPEKTDLEFGKSSKRDIVADARKRGLAKAEAMAQEKEERKKGTTTSDGYLEYASVPGLADYLTRAEAGKATADREQRGLGTAMDLLGLSLAGPVGLAASRRLRKSEERTAGQMDETEEGIYAYLYDRYGMAAAEQYKDTLRGDLNRKYMEQLEGREKENAARNPLLSVVKDVYMAVQQPVEYIDSLGLGIADRLTGRDMLDPNSPMFTATATTGAIREGINENESLKRMVPNETVRGLLTGTGLSMAETLARLPMGNAGLAFAAGGAASSAERDALQAGAGDGQAILRGAAQGAAEALFEKVSLEGLERFKPGAVTGVRSFLKNMGKQAFTEGSEEFFTEIANTASDAAIMGELSDYNQNIRNYRQEYMDQGMSEEEADKEAKWSAFRDFLGGLGLAAAGGALSGGLMGAGAQGLSLASEYAQGRPYNPDFRDYAQGIDTDAGNFTNAKDYWQARQLQRTAEEYAARQGNGETVNPILRSRFKNDLEGYIANVAESQTRQQERQTQARSDAEELLRRYRERQMENRGAETAAGADSAFYEGNTAATTENGTAAAPAGQSAVQAVQDAVVNGRDASAEMSRQAAEQMARQAVQSSLQDEAEAYARETAAAGQQMETVEPGQLEETPVRAAEPFMDSYEGNTGVSEESGTAAAADGQTGMQGAAEQYARETAANRQRGTSRVSNEQLDLYGEDYGAEGRKAFRDAYRMNEGTDMESYYRAFARQYNVGRYNMTLSAGNQAAVAAVLTPEQMEAAYRAGARDRNAEIGYDPETYEMRGMRQGTARTGGLAEASPLASDAQKRVADAVGKRTGLKFVLTDDGEASGSYRKGEVRISVNARNFLGTTSHELTHFIKEYSPDMYQIFEDRTLGYLSEADGMDLESMVRSYRARYEQVGQTLSREEIMEEIVANATERFLNDPEYVDKIAGENRSLGRKILDFINDVIDAIKSLIRTEAGGTRAARALESDLDHLEECRELWMQGLEEAGERYASGMELKERSEGTDERFKLARPDQVTDEQIEENYQSVREMEPVAELTGEEFAKADGTIKEQVGRFFDSIGNVAHNDVVGDVILNLESIRDDIAHGVSRNKVASYRAVPDVIRNGHVLDYSGQRVVMGAKVIMGGEEYFELCIATVNQENRLYLHEVCAVKTDENAPFWTKAAKSRRLSGASHPSPMSIFKKLIFVNATGENSDAKVFRYQLENVDADGNEMSREQEEYFRNSKVRDKNGRLLVMYHGTPDASFTEFREGTYFTQNKAYADGYQAPGASMLTKKQSAPNPGTYKVYLNIEKPFDTRIPAVRKVWDTMFYRKWGTGTPLQDSGLPDWTDGTDIQEFIEEEGLDYDGIVLDEGGYYDRNGGLMKRGESYMIMSAEQVKNIDNKRPTRNRDIRYQLDGVDVEEMEDKNLVAIHNLSEERLLNNLELGGFPAPSIAIGKADVGHEGYGDISVVFRKETIDPADRRNHVFSADAYTPRFPQIDYAVNEGEAKKLADRFGMSEGYLEANVLDGGDPERAAKRMEDLREVRETYIREKGIKVEPVAHMPSMSYINGGNGVKQFLSRTDVTFDGILRDADMRSAYVASAVQGLKQDVASKRTDTLNRRLDRCLTDQEEYDKNQKLFEKDMRVARGEAQPQLDQYSYEEGVNNAIGEHRADYQKYVRDLLAPAFGDRYIRNSREKLTSSGSSRSFRELHYPYTLENIVRAMNEGEGIKNRESGLMTGAGEIRAAVSRELGSIEDIRSESARIQNISDEEIGKIYGEMDRMMLEITRRLSSMDGNENQFIAMDNASGILVEAYGAGKTRQRIRRVIEGYYGKIPDELMDRIMQLREYAAQIPVKYFEAKPMRPIGMDEVAAVVLPETSSETLKERLLEAGVKTVEYDPDEPGARKRAVNDLKGVRFQLEDVDDYEAQINDLLHENEELRSANEMLKREFELTSKDALRQEDIHKVTGKILKKYNSGLDQGTLDRNVGKLYEYIRSSEQVDGRELSQVAADIGRSILMQSKQKDTTFTEQYKELRNYIKNSPVMISEQDRKDLAAAGGYNEFRKKYFGKIKLGNKGMSVDSFYEQLNEMDPNWFNLDITHPADRLMTIAGFLDATDAQVRNPYHANMDEMSYMVGQELLEAYFDVRSPKPTFADRQAQEADRIRRDYSRKMAEYKRKISNRYEAILAERDRDMARTKDAHAQELLAQKAKYEKQIQLRRESLQKREAKTRIIREVNTMRKWLLSPTDTKHVPQQLRTVMADFLGSIDFSSKEDINGVQTQRTQLWLEAKAAFDQIANAGGMMTDDEGNVRYLDLDPDLQERFGEIAGKVKNLDKLENLDSYTLEEVYKTVLAMKKAVTEVDAMKSNARYRKTSILADEVFENLDGRKTKTEYTKWAGMPGKLLNYDMVDPLTMFNRMGPAFGTLYDSLRNGLDKKTQLLKEAEDYFRNAMEENGFAEKDVRKLTGMNADVKEFSLPQGKLKLSVAQIMSLYELDKRGQAQKHIYDRAGGIRPADRQTGFSAGKDGVRLPKLDRAEKPLRVSKEQVRMITDTLTPEQKRLADAMQQFMGDRAAAWGNEVSMEMYGYEKFTARNYFPIRTDQNYVFRDENGQAEITIKNLGMTKSTNAHANNPIIIEDIFDVFTRQADQMSSYNAYVLPLSDLHKVMNYKDMRGNAGGASIQDELQRVFGKDGRDYIDKLVKDINGSVQGEKGGVSDMLLSNFKAASVAGNLRVAIQQPTAIARAYAEIDLKYLAKGTATPGKGKWDLICRYAPIAQWKDWGFYRMQTSRQMKDILTGSDSAKQRFVNRTMILAEKGDQVAWERLWNACEAECQEKHPELEKGSEDFYRRVGKRFSGIVDRTQVADSILHRTQIMRNTNGLVKMATSFMGEPLKSYNMLYRAAMELNDAAAEIRTNGKSEAGSRKETDAGRKLARAGVAFVANAGLTALAASVMDAMRDSDRDKDWLEKYRENVRQNFLDNINMLNNIPYVKEIPSIIKGYTPTRSDLSAFTDIYNVCKKWEKFYAGTSKQTFQSMIMETAQAASKITGIPVKSIVRDATALLDTAFNAAGGEADYLWIRQQYAIGAKGNRRMYADMILDSEERGDNKLAQQIREDLLEAGVSEDDINDSINSAVNARIEDEVDIIGAAEAYDAYNKESVNVFKGEIDKYIYYKKKAGWDEDKCLKQIRTNLTNEYKPKWKAAKTKEEKEAIIKKCKSFFYNGDSIYKDYDFERYWKNE